MFETFESKINEGKWENVPIEHDCQTDHFNCGVFLCQYVEAILLENVLVNLVNPNTYRDTIKLGLENYADEMSEICLHCGDKCGAKTTFVCIECRRPACVGCTSYRYT